MKKFFVYALLVSFVVLLTPRGIWHQHHDDDAEHLTSHSKSLDAGGSHSGDLEEDCFQCDYDLDTAPQALSLIFRFSPANTYIPPKSASYIVAQQKLDTDSLRGPPAA